jgi:gas vesicle protein
VYGFNSTSGNSGSLGTSSYGVSGTSTSGSGVYGSSTNGDGMVGTSTNGYGVSGTSSSWQGVRGNSTSGTGVYGFNSTSGNSGSLGTSSYGVSGTSTSGSGVYGSSNSGNGVYGYSSSGYAGYFNGNVYVTNNVSALSYTDRTPYPKDLATAYQAVMSMEKLPDGEYQENNKEEQLDHSKLSDFIRSKDGKRDLSATVSCQNEVIKDLIKQNKELIGQNKELNKRIEALEQKPAERMAK